MDVSSAQARLFSAYTKGATKSERGEVLKYFADKMGWKIGRVARKVQGLNLQDLYFVKSSCDLYERDGSPWRKAFNGMLKV